MNLKKNLIGIASATAIIAAPLALSATPAHAAPSAGPLYLTPTTGNTNTLATVRVADGSLCPAGYSGTTLYMSGAGVTEETGGLNGFTSPAQSQVNGHMEVPVTTLFADIFQANSITQPTGAYNLRLACVGDDFFTEVAEYNTTVTFTPFAGNYNANYTTAAMPAPAAPTTTTLSGPTTATFGDNITLTADVTDGATGSVQLKDGATNVGAPVVISNGTATVSLPVNNIAAGSHSYTAAFVPSGNFQASTSAAHAVSVAKSTPSVTLSTNTPTVTNAAANFTATVSPAAAGTVTFKEGATVLGTGTVNGSGVATASANFDTAGDHVITAEFAPTDAANVNSATSAPFTHTVSDVAPATATSDIEVDVPTGELTISVNDIAPAGVKLGNATLDADAQWRTSTGSLDEVTVTDTRAGGRGWTATGQVTNFVKGANEINGYNLGWTPTLVSKLPLQTAAAGAPVLPAKEALANTTPSNNALGLKTARVLGTGTAGSATGTAIFDADLTLKIPTTAPAGTYRALLTFTAI